MPSYVLTPPVCLHAPHVWTPPIYLDAPICLDTTHIFGCLAVCLVAPIYVALLGTLFSLLQCLDAPCMFDAPICLDTTHMFGCPLYVWTPPICLDTPYMFGCPHMFGCTPYMFGCPHMFGCTPYMFGCPHMFGWPPVCLNAPICLDSSLYVWMHPTFGCPLYVLMTPYVAPCMFGSPHMCSCHLEFLPMF